MSDINLQINEPRITQNKWAWGSLLARFNLTQLKRYFLPVFYTLFLLGFFFFPSSKSHSNFFYVAVAFPFLILIFLKKVALRSFFSSRIFLLSTVFLIYMFATLFWSNNYELSDIYKNGRRVFYVLVFLSATIHLIQVYPNFLQRLMVLLCWAAASFAAVYIVFYYTQHPFPSSRLYGFGQLHNPIMASSVYGIVFIACIFLFLQQHTMKTKLPYLGMSMILFLYMLLAQSRGPLLALGFTIFGWTILECMLHKKGKYVYLGKLCVVLLLIILVGVSLFIAYPDFLKSRFIERKTHRLEVWGKAFLQAKDAPVFGHGLKADTRIVLSRKKKTRPHHHSVYIETLFFGGIAGLLLLTVLVGLAFRQAFTRTERLQKFLLTSMLVFGSLCIMTDGNTLIRHPKPVWIFFWFPIALVAASELSSNLLPKKQTTTGVGYEASALQ